MSAAAATALVVALVLVPPVTVMVPPVTASSTLAEPALAATLAEASLGTLLTLGASLGGVALGTGVPSGRAPFAGVGGSRLRCRRRRLLGLLGPGNGFLRRLLIAHVLWCVGRARSQRCGRSMGRGNVDLGKLRGKWLSGADGLQTSEN